MAGTGNPFKERATDRTTSDQAFVRLFSPKILENLPEAAFKGGVHLFVSPPGGGKTTLLRAFAPSVLQSFAYNKDIPEMKESAKLLQELGVFDSSFHPQMLGVQLSCLSGYADLPSGMSMEHDGLFRALLNCRIVLRALRSLATMLNANSIEQLTDVFMEYPRELQDLTAIPKETSVVKLAQWAEQCERKVYSYLDALIDDDALDAMPAHVRFEGVLWLQGVKFNFNGKELAPRRLLMIDDLQALRRRQRELLKREFLDLRPKESVWLAQRTSALTHEDILSSGAREGRDVELHSLESLLGNSRNGFASFAQNVIDRRFETQTVFQSKFEQYLRTDIPQKELSKSFEIAVERYRQQVARFRTVTQYQDWIATADAICEKEDATLDDLRVLYTTRILIARNEKGRQLSFVPLAVEELEERDSSATQGAATIFAHDETSLPYYFGMDMLCALATNNIEELLGLAACLYDGLEANQMLRRSGVFLNAREQERLLVDAAKKKREFIPRSHAEGTRAKLLIDAIGGFCREKTFVPAASYAPGVTGVRLAQSELDKLVKAKEGPTKLMETLRRVLAECVADNLLFVKPSAPTTGREGGQVFYMNRTLCAYFGLPLAQGGWQDVKVSELMEWMQLGRKPTPRDLDL